uniref:Sugar kinase n=1 Tax=Acidobacterium capsulatum TaxID=33075 RepID=A0A7V4XQK2_9BACT
MSLLPPLNRTHYAWDCLALGEIMLRFDPGEGRIHTTRQFAVWEGGGEYNVVRGLRRCFGLRTAVATAFADNPVGRLVEDLVLQGGVDTSLIRWLPYDGVGRAARNGLYFLERGFGQRPGVACFDRGHTAIAQVKPGDFDWTAIFAQGVRWFHTGGIFAGLSATSPQVALEAIRAARAAGTIVSFDLNYRDSLWREFGGNAEATRVNQQLVREVDVLIGGEEDFRERLGIPITVSPTKSSGPMPLEGWDHLLREVAGAYPNLKVIAATRRTVTSSMHNTWGGVVHSQGQTIEVPLRPIEILDRVGGGDSFASGFIYGLLQNQPLEWALRCGVAHGMLTMTTPGDASMVTLAEVEHAMADGSIRMRR